MAPPRRVPCQVCSSAESKYTCAKCNIVYCSVPCYKRHQETCPGRPPSTTHSVVASSTSATANMIEPQSTQAPSDETPSTQASQTHKPEEKEAPLRSLASLKWPYVPEESAYPDPLKRDDPKPLQLSQYEAIATSQTVRRVIASNPRLRDILRSIDALRGEERELALQEALGIGGARTHALASLGHASNEDRDALRQLAEAVEGAVRNGKEGMLGLDWGD
ncbi:hypothetical protein K466DRAFT_174588 [Polyporus arcularius HHB13444]|uniref:HIT-type domain-containing protein n=1 Tax=Polyporus arcularius HHB13444 TaxID=1314778 RepID=A0A5C3P8I3_9APHY|nr:hypothetical protein K466DRAFT_174588 [Polyporus arcularius HHB13444]